MSVKKDGCNSDSLSSQEMSFVQSRADTFSDTRQSKDLELTKFPSFHYRVVASTFGIATATPGQAKTLTVVSRDRAKARTLVKAVVHRLRIGPVCTAGAQLH